MILAEREGFVIPVSYALLPSKSEDCYRLMFQLIRTAWPALEPEAISTDFEQGLMNAIGTVFPNAEIQGCFFHLVKNLEKKVADLKLMSRYRTEPDFLLATRMKAALAFVPPGSIDSAIGELAVYLPEDLMPVLKYFENNYVGKLLHVLPDKTTLRKDPLFRVNTWSVYERTINNENRTNSFVEAAHRRLQTEFGVKHSSLWRFIKGLKKVQRHRDLLFARSIAGNLPAAKRKKYSDTDRRILHVVHRFNDLLHVEYLQGIACNFVMEA